MQGNRRAVEGQERKFSLALRSQNPFAPCSANQLLGLVDYRSISELVLPIRYAFSFLHVSVT